MSAHWKNQVQASLMPSKDTVPIHRMQIWRTTRQAPGTSCMKVRLVWPRCFVLFWYWSIDDQSTTTQKSFIDWHRLGQDLETDITHATCPIIRHFQEALGTKQFTPRLLSAKNIPCCTRTRITHLSDIAFLCHNIYARRPGRGFTEYTVHRQRLSSIMLLLLAVSLFA